MQKRYASATFNQGTLITLFAHANILIVIFVNYKDYPNEIIGYLNVQIKCIGYKFVLINFLISLRRMLLPYNYDYDILCCYDNKRLQKFKKGTLYTKSNSHWHTKLVDLQDVYNVLGVFELFTIRKKRLKTFDFKL